MNKLYICKNSNCDIVGFFNEEEASQINMRCIDCMQPLKVSNISYRINPVANLVRRYKFFLFGVIAVAFSLLLIISLKSPFGIASSKVAFVIGAIFQFFLCWLAYERCLSLLNDKRQRPNRNQETNIKYLHSFIFILSFNVLLGVVIYLGL